LQQVLVYSDSLSSGIVPTTRKRLSSDARWPGVMEIVLAEQGHSVRVIEDRLNATRQAPIEPGMPIPPILVVAPPPILNPRGPIAKRFIGAAGKAAGLSGVLQPAAT
jgi:hypothetical protein